MNIRTLEDIKRAQLIVKSIASDLALTSQILKSNQMAIADRSIFICQQNIALVNNIVSDELTRLCNEKGKTI